MLLWSTGSWLANSEVCLVIAVLLTVIDQLSDIEWLPSEVSGSDNDADDDGDKSVADDVLSIDVQDSPVVNPGLVHVTRTFPLPSLSQVCCSQQRQGHSHCLVYHRYVVHSRDMLVVVVSNGTADTACHLKPRA